MDDRTAHAAATPYDFRVGDWLVAPRGNRLIGPGGPVRLEPKVMQVLTCLAAQPGRTVTKDEFMERVWGDTVVSDDVLARCISELRKVFGDSPRNPDYIETIRKSGYRLIAPVAPPDAEAPGAETAEEPGARADIAGREPAAVPEATEGLPARPEESVEVGAVAESATEGAEAPVSERAHGGNGTPSAVAAPHRRVAHRRAAHRPRRERWLWGGIAAVALLVAAVGWIVWPRGGAEPLRSVPFTSFPGAEAEPTLSPDGEQIAFTWTGIDDGPVDIYVKQTGAEMPLRLTETPADEWSPAWSPDGRQIAFVRSTGSDTRAVVVVPAIGGSERTVADFEGREVERVAWSPDGETLALSVQAEPTGPFGLHLLSLETLSLRRLTEPEGVAWGDIDPAFSPNGERLAFVRSASPGVEDLFVVPVGGGEPERLTDDEREIHGLDWMPDGRSIVFASARAEGAGLWRIAASGGEPVRIATSGEGESVRQPSVSRLGRRLTYEQRSADSNIWAIQRGRFGSEPLIRSTRWESHPQFAPSGDLIAFASDRSGSPEVWVVNGDGQNPIQLTDFGGPLVTTPRWSPDGRQIAFSARVDGNADIYLIDSNGGRPVRLTEDPASDVAPSWSLDSTTVYFSSDRSGTWEVWRMPAAGGSPSRVTYDGGYNAFESPDGEMLYYAKKGEPGLWRRGPGGEDETLVLGALEPFDWGNWAVTGDGIYFIRREATGPTIRFYNFVTGRSSPVVRLDDVPEHPALTVSPDGRVLLYTHVDRDESDLLLVEDFQ
jgi:Tol biopolymer transport system component/DNA-binding winged helix-turn-helix (wHTH) protein